VGNYANLRYFAIFFSLLILLVLGFQFCQGLGGYATRIEYSDFLKEVDSANIKSVTFYSTGRIYGEFKNSTAGSSSKFEVQALLSGETAYTLSEKIRSRNPDAKISQINA